MSGNAFTAGNRPGGLNNEDQIRFLVCYLVSQRRQKLTPSDVLETVTSCGAANYFECADAISDMQNKNHIAVMPSGKLDITDSGKTVASGLVDDLPFSVRQRVIEACDKYLQYKTNIGQHKVTITPAEPGYNVKCVIADLGTPVFTMELFAPTAESAQTIRERFIQNGAKLYQDVLDLLT